MAKYATFFNYYVVTYEHGGPKIFSADEAMVEVDELVKVKSGFWINHDFEYTQGSDCWYWVPPGQIKMIIKLETEDDNLHR